MEIRDKVISQEIVSQKIQTNLLEVGDLQLQTFSCDELVTGSLNYTTNIIQNFSSSNTLTGITATVTGSVTANTFSIPALSTPSINFTQATVSDNVSADIASISEAFVENGTSDSFTAVQIASNQLKATTGNSVAENNFTVRTGETTAETEFYVSPSEGVFRGIAFFKDVDVGISSPSAKISMNMRSENNTPFLTSYNTFLGDIDGGTAFGSSKALLSLCTNTSPARTLRFQEDGNLAIYSDNTKIWQNGSMVSDARLKENLRPITSAMDKILQINGVSFEYNGIDSGKSCGVILENVESIFPECTNEGLVYLEKLTPLLIEGLKELRQRNELIRSMRLG